MARQFDHEWSDFSGGLFVGPTGTKQPANTFTGTDVMTSSADGMLMPAGHLFETHTSNPVCDADGRMPMLHAFTPALGQTLIYAKDNANIARTDVGAWPAAVGNVATGADTMVVPSLGCIPFSASVCFPESAGAGGLLFYQFLLAVGDPNIGAATMGKVTGVVIYDQFLCTWGNTSAPNRMWYSSPGSAMTWPTNNFVDICPSSSSIKTMVVMNGDLLIGCTDGWYAITGVLGGGASKRKISNDGMTGIAVTNSAAVRDGVIHSGPNHNGVPVSILRGSTVSPVMYHRDDGETLSSSFVEDECYVVRVGAYTMVRTGAAAVTPRLFVRAPNGTWRSHAVAVSSLAYSEVNWSKYAYASVSNGAGHYILNRYELEPTSPVCRNAAGAWRSSTATATLAEYQSDRKFKVDEVLIEFDYGFGGDGSTVRSVGASMLMRGMQTETTDDTDFIKYSANVSNGIVQVVTIANAGQNERAWIRVSPNDGGYSYTMQPQIVMQGVKVRRVIARCREIA